MCDKEHGKKFCEEIDLDYFREAYADVTGEHLSGGRRTERPDFICTRDTGEEVGIELVKVMRDPESATWDLLIGKRESAEAAVTFDMLWYHADRKETKRKEPDWQLPESCMLVIQLMNCPLAEFASHIDESLAADFESLGWQEIWAADFTVLDAYGEVWLFGLYPKKWWGPHVGPSAGTKPYG